MPHFTQAKEAAEQTRSDETRLGECDSCWELAKLNEYNLCRPCDAGADAFNLAAGKCQMAGGSPEDALKAGKQADTAAKNKVYTNEYIEDFYDHLFDADIAQARRFAEAWYKHSVAYDQVVRENQRAADWNGPGSSEMKFEDIE